MDGSTMDAALDAEPMDAALDAEPMDAAADGPSGPDGGVPGCALDSLLIVTSDFTTAEIGRLDLITDAVSVGTAPLADQDSVADLSGCTPLLLGRGAGEVRLQSPGDPFVTERTIDIDPAGVTDFYASNPQRVITVSETQAYVLPLSRNELVIIDPSLDGAAAITGTLDLSELLSASDADGLLEISDAVLVETTLYVALGRYFFDASWAIHFDAGSVLAVIDTTTDSLIDMDAAVAGVQGIALTGNNPWRGLWHEPSTNRLFVGTTGDGFANDGGIEIIDLATQTSSGYALLESTLGAEIGGFAGLDAETVFVLSGAEVLRWNPSTDAIDAAAVAAEVSGLLVHQGALFVWGASGLRRFDAPSGLETTPSPGPWSFGALPIVSASAAP